MQEILLKIRYFEGDYQNPFDIKIPLSKPFFPFRNQSLLMDEVIKNKRGLELVTSSSSGYKASLQKFLY